MTGDRDTHAQGAQARRAGSPLRVLRASRVPEPPPRPATPGRVGEDLRNSGAPTGAASRRARTDSRPRNMLLPRLKRWQPVPGAVRRGDTDARWRRVRGRLGLAALLLVQAAFAGLVIWALTSPTWQVRYVQVEGTDDTALATAVQTLPLTGCNIFRCDTAHQTRLITRLPAVARAEVHAAYPDGLVVVVVPRRPALLWHIGDTGYVVATDGTVLGPQASDPAFAQAPLLDVVDSGAAAFGGRAPAPGQRMDAGVAEMARQLRSGLTALGTGWMLQWTTDTGFVALKAGGQRVLFGTPEDAAQTAAALSSGGTADTSGVAAQLRELRDVLARLSSRGEHATLIDLRWGAHPYYRT